MEETRLGTTEVVVGQVVTLGWSACRLADPVDRKTLLKLFCLLDEAVDTLSDAAVTALLGGILDLHTSAVVPDGWLHKHKGAARVAPDAGSGADRTPRGRPPARTARAGTPSSACGCRAPPAPQI